MYLHVFACIVPSFVDMTISDGILSITASTTSRRHRWTNMMIYQNDRGNTIPLLQDVLLLCKISHYHTLSTLVSPAKTFVSLVNQPCDHGSKWAGLGWSQMGNTLQWKITHLFSRKRNMRISGFNILLSQKLCAGFRPQELASKIVSNTS